MASINPAPVQAWLEGRTEIDEFISHQKTRRNASLHGEDRAPPRAFAWVYLDTPPTRSRIDYGSALTFPISKIGDVMGPVFLSLISAFKFVPVLDTGWCARCAWPPCPTPPPGRPWRLSEGWTCCRRWWTTWGRGPRGRRVLLGHEPHRHHQRRLHLPQPGHGGAADKSWTYTLPSNQGGADNNTTSNNTRTSTCRWTCSGPGTSGPRSATAPCSTPTPASRPP